MKRKASPKTTMLVRSACVLLFLTAVLFGQLMGEDGSVMQEYLWKKRPLIVFAPGQDHPEFREQVEAYFAEPAETKDRDMVLIRVVGEQVLVDDKASSFQAEELRNRYAVAADRFTALLVGKDGGVKLRGEEAAPMVVFFSLIDVMPMRKEEMRRRESKE